MKHLATWEAFLAGCVILLAAVLRLGRPTLTEFKFSEARLEALALEWTREDRLPLVGVPSSAGFDYSPLGVYSISIPSVARGIESSIDLT